MDIFLLIGQSNMAGRGALEEVAPIEHPNILMFRDGAWRQALDPLHDDGPRAGVGPGMSFAAELVERDPDTRIGLVPCAVGGTPLSRWEPGADLYENAIATARPALSEGRLRAFLWHQGESDARDESLSASYEKRLTATISGFRQQLSVPDAPFITGEHVPSLKDDFVGRATVRAALEKLAQALPACALVSSEGLVDSGDLVHFDSPSMREFGRRYAQSYLALTSS